MMMLPSGVRVHIAIGVTDMRKGLDGLAMLVQGVLAEDPFSGHLFAFRGRKANLGHRLARAGTDLAAGKGWITRSDRLFYHSFTGCSDV